MVRVTIKVYSIMEEVVGMPKFEVTVPENTTVEEVLKYVVQRYKSGFEKRYHIEGGAWDLMKYFNIVFNGTILNTGGLEAEVKEGDTVDIREPIAGG